MTDFPIKTDDVIRVAAFRAALREFLRTSEEIAQADGFTPRRHLLLLLIKGAPDGSEQATITELAQRLPSLPRAPSRNWSIAPRRLGRRARALL